MPSVGKLLRIPLLKLACIIYQFINYHIVFIPIFTLEGQEGRLFGPLAFTKTYAMAVLRL